MLDEVAVEGQHACQGLIAGLLFYGTFVGIQSSWIVVTPHCLLGLEFPALVTLETCDERCHGFVCRACLQLIVVALGLLFAT